LVSTVFRGVPVVPCVGALATAGLASAVPAGARPADGPAGAGPVLGLAPVLSGASLSHVLPSGSKEPLSQPDDLAALSGQLYVVFQNNVGADRS
jgi:hypothetical protein